MAQVWGGGFPRKGWVLADVEDLDDLDENCQACGTEIRYVHTLTHLEHSDMRVGCMCAEHMTEDYTNPKLREKDLRRRAVARRKYPFYYGHKWTDLSRGNGQWTRHEGCVIQVRRYTWGHLVQVFNQNKEVRRFTAGRSIAKAVEVLGNESLLG